MSSGRVGWFRWYVVALGFVPSTSVFSQATVGFEELDRDANGRISRGEFSRMPGFGGAELFADIDKNRDLFLSRDEWIAASPDAQGIPQGLLATARQPVDAAALRPKVLRHGASLPSPPPQDRTYKPLSNAEQDKLRTGSTGVQPARPPPVRMPSPPPPIPPEARPPR